MEYQPHKDATAHGVSLFCGRMWKEEQDCEVPEHTHRTRIRQCLSQRLARGVCGGPGAGGRNNAPSGGYHEHGRECRGVMAGPLARTTPP
ncbi:jg14164, partial [Pararge aegeria aegeria]